MKTIFVVFDWFENIDSAYLTEAQAQDRCNALKVDYWLEKGKNVEWRVSEEEIPFKSVVFIDVTSKNADLICRYEECRFIE